MSVKKKRPWITALVIVLCICFVISIAPYLIPVTTAKSISTAPFPESAFLETQGVDLAPENRTSYNVRKEKEKD